MVFSGRTPGVEAASRVNKRPQIDDSGATAISDDQVVMRRQTLFCLLRFYLFNTEDYSRVVDRLSKL